MQSEEQGIVDRELELRLEETIRLFGYTKLTAQQNMLVRAAIAGQDTLGILPTGSGKSACFQIPGIVRHYRTLVVSPLIALQEDQIRKLRLRGIKAFCLHSGLTENRKLAVHFYYKKAPENEPSFLYLSPEYLLTETFQNNFGGVQFHYLAVDEAHCVSTWGDAFRPDYQRIRVAVQRLKIPQCSAFTATTDPKIERDIRRRIPLNPRHLRVVGDPFRPNLQLQVRRPASAEEHELIVGKRKFVTFMNMITNKEFNGPTIVYCNSRDLTFNLWKRMHRGWPYWTCLEEGYTSYLFHAGLPYEDKEKALEGFLHDPKPIIFATSAFGMGIDRADVRQVIHYNPPKTLIDYAQQIGRAGRDGKPSLCTMFFLIGETLRERTQRDLWEVPTYDFVESVHKRLWQIYIRHSRVEDQRYNLGSFLRHMHRLVEGSKIVWKEQYLSRVTASVAILQRAGVIKEDSSGLTVREIAAGSREHHSLLEMTAMDARKLEREGERLVRFFTSDVPDQGLLWDIIKTDEFPEFSPAEQTDAVLEAQS